MMPSSQLTVTLKHFFKVLSLQSKLRRVRKQHNAAPSTLSPTTLQEPTNPCLQQRTQCQETPIEELRAHNSEQPISQLPNELLINIFLAGSLPPQVASFPNLIKKHCTTKRYLAQVCYRWRAVALDCPDIWCNAVDLDSSAYWIREVLRRTRGRPINVFISPTTKEEHIAFVLHTQSVRGIYADIRDWNLVLKTIQCMLELEDLEEVELQTCRVGSKCLAQLDSWSSNSLYQRFPPKLRRLYLAGLFPLPSQTAQSLTCLYISRPWGRRTADQWLDIIRRFPQLRDLTLDGCVKEYSGDRLISEDGLSEELSPVSFLPVSLPRLQVLQLKGEYLGWGSFFRGLVIPSSCALRVDGYDMAVGPTLDALVAFLQSIRNQPSPMRRSTKRHLFVRASPSQFHVQVSEEEVVELDVNLKYTERYGKHADVAASIFQRLVTATYQRFRNHGAFATLTVTMSRRLSTVAKPSKEMVQYLHSCLLPQEIRSLRLQNDTAAHHLLQMEDGDGAGVETARSGDAKGVPYPEVQWIAFSQVDFEGIGVLVTQAPRRLIAFVMRRSAMQGVRLINCKYPQWMVGRLLDLGVEVIVD